MAHPDEDAVSLDVDAGRSLIGVSVAMRQVRELIARVAPTDTTVLITGETGTGKELVARLIHKLSARSMRPLVAEDCNTITPTLFESELFGHERGAFTGADRPRVGVFEQADGSTLFLDEIANISVETQARLLRVLQEREFRRLGGRQIIHSNFRLITATNADLVARAEAGLFREDLLHRLLVARIDLAPLRDRRSDVPLLVSYFVEQKRTRLERPEVCRVSHAAMDLLGAHDWPGNVRELENVIEAAILRCAVDTIDVPHIAFARGQRPEPPADDVDAPFRAARLNALAQFERRYLITQLRRYDGSVKETARHAGISGKHVRELLRRHGIDRRDFRPPSRLQTLVRELSRTDTVTDSTPAVRIGDDVKR